MVSIPAYSVGPGVETALANFSAPAELGFGVVPAPVMFSAEFRNGA